MKTLALVLAAAAALQVAPAAAQSTAAVGGTVTPPPAPHSVFNVSGGALFRANDVYRAAPRGFTVVPPPLASWHYCDALRSQYPAVPQCADSWSVLPATAPPLR